MKRILTVAFVFIMTAALLLAACDSTPAEESSVESALSSAASSTSEESSVAVSEGSSEWVSEDIQEITSQVTSEEDSEESEPGQVTSQPDEEPNEPPEDAVKLLFSRYTKHPSFVIIGTCAQGADITAKVGSQEITVPSYMGWFVATLKAEGGNKQEITLTQTVDGQAYDIPRTFVTTVTTPQNLGTTALASNDAFQFFLAQMIPDHMGTARLFSDSEISSMVSRVKGRLEQLKSNKPDAEIIYMVVPSPMTTYPELVPEDYPKGSGKSRFEQVMEALSGAGATVIDLRETFREHKNDEMPLYYKLDSHWSDYGAYVAYQALFEHIAEQFPDAAPRAIDQFDWNPDYYESGDMSFYLAMSQQNVKEFSYYRTFDFDAPASITSIKRYRSDTMLCYSNAVTEQNTIRTNRENLPSCIVFRDSYSTQLYDILAERMNETNYMGMWGFAWSQSQINSIKPDYIIYVVAEWNLDSVIYN